MQTVLPKPASIYDVWTDQEAFIAWKTVALFFVIVVGWAGVAVGLNKSVITAIQAVPISTLLIYLSFTVAHEAGHRNIAQGVDWMIPVERVMGWLCVLPFIVIPFSLFARIHDYHHAHTNDPDRDPDYWVSSDSWLMASLKSLALPLHYILRGSSQFNQDQSFKETKLSSITYWFCMSGLLGYLVFAGFGQTILIAWVLPVIMASFILAMLFDWIPHRPNIQQSPYQNTRIYLAPFANMLTLGQSYHLIHHLNPRVPWYAYKRVFNQVREELDQQQAPIESLSGGLFPRIFKAPSIISAINPIEAGKFTLTVNSVASVATDAVCITFDDKETQGFRFKAGQYLTLSKLINNEWLTRCYSVCSAESSKSLSVVVRRVPNGTMSCYLNDTLRSGDKLTVAGPFGDFVLNDKSVNPAQNLVMVAGGSGITPIMSMLHSALEANINQIVLIYCNHSSDNVIFKQELEQLNDRYGERLTIHYINSMGEASEDTMIGRLTPSVLTGLVSELTDNTQYYICGPDALKNMVKQTLLDTGVAENQVHHEDFVLAPKQPEGELFNVVLVLNDGAEHQLKVAENQTVLEVAKQQGIKLPHACGVGLCGSCMLTRVSGDEAYSSDKTVALLSEERKLGKTLACQCQPRSDMHLKVLNH